MNKSIRCRTIKIHNRRIGIGKTLDNGDYVLLFKRADKDIKGNATITELITKLGIDIMQTTVRITPEAAYALYKLLHNEFNGGIDILIKREGCHE